MQHKPAATDNTKSSASIWQENSYVEEDLSQLTTEHQQNRQLPQPELDEEENFASYTDDNEKLYKKSQTNSNTIKYNVNNNLILNLNLNEENEEENDDDNVDDDLDHSLDHHVNIEKCAKNCKRNQKFPKDLTTESNKNIKNYTPMSSASLTYPENDDDDDHNDQDDDNEGELDNEEDESTTKSLSNSKTSTTKVALKSIKTSNKQLKQIHSLPSQMPLMSERNVYFKTHESPAKLSLKALKKTTKKEHQRIHVAHRLQHKEVKTHRESTKQKHYREIQKSFKAAKTDHNKRSRRETEETDSIQSNESTKALAQQNEQLTTLNAMLTETTLVTEKAQLQQQQKLQYLNESLVKSSAFKTKRSHSNVRVPVEVLNKPKESMVIIDDGEEFEGAAERQREYAAMGVIGGDDKSEDYMHDEEPRVLPLRPVLPNPYEDEEMSVVYAEQHSEIRLMCEVDLDIASSMWYKNGQVSRKILKFSNKNY